MQMMADALWTQQQADKDLPGRIGYRIVRVNQNAKSRVQRIVMGYRGPDSATLSLLDLEAPRWLQSPARFFDGHGRAVAHDSRDPQLELLHLFLRTERDTV